MIRLGITLQESRAILGEPTETKSGHWRPGWVNEEDAKRDIYIKDKPGGTKEFITFIADPTQRIRQIQIINGSEYSTTQGARAGASEDRVLETFGNPTRKAWDSNNRRWLFCYDTGISFDFEYGGTKKLQAISVFSPNDFEDIYCRRFFYKD